MNWPQRHRREDDELPAYAADPPDFAFESSDDRAARLRARLGSLDEADASALISALGDYAQLSDASLIVPLLHHNSPAIAAVVEEALWSIWLRSGSPAANRALAAALDLLPAAPFDALAAIRALCADEPTFAEAHHQRGLLACELELHDEAAAAFETAYALNPLHFGALTGLGTVWACRGDFAAAAAAFRDSLAINPRQELARQFLALAAHAPIPNLP
ncbi:MAG: hypothetical protein CHACPFDD_01796 [Phycisphaerae bacterium]|nr:hypothetical protein [Phycisphaerae bacterium]